MKKLILNTIGVSLALFFIGCSSSSGSSSNLTKGYLLDSPIVGVNYICGDISGTTKSGGKFECKVAPVSFSIGGYLLGTISAFTADGNVYLQDLLGLQRTNFTDTNLIELARLIQSLDDDGDISDAITITAETAAKFGTSSNSATLEELATMAGVTLVSQASALEHLYSNSVAGSSGTTNHIPVANAQSVTLNEDTTKAVTLTATDVDGDTLTYSVVANPSHGTLSGTAPSLTYTPTANYQGSDSFTFKVNDGIFDSTVKTVTITVTNVNDAPTATAQSVTVNEDSTSNAITLAGVDVDGDTLTYTIVTSTTHGTLGGTGSSKTYTPTANYNGSDSFTFKVSDGTLTSAVATVSITVTNVNDAPVISKTNLSTSFTDHNITNCDSNFTQVFTIDLNDDNSTDIVTASMNDNRIAWYKNDGSQVFTEHNISLTAKSAFSVYALDVDGDSIKDVLAVGHGDDNISWYKNNGSEVFTEKNISKAIGTGSIFAMDIDGDNGIDILTTSQDGNVTWYENDSSENFTKHNLTDMPGATYAYAVDFNGSGHIDILATASKEDDKNSTVLYRNDGSENFTSFLISDKITNEARAVYATDFDGDGDKEVFVAAINKIMIYENNGTNATPDFKEHNITDSDEATFINVFVMDIDTDDTLKDIFTSRVWYENNGTTTNPDFRRHLYESNASYIITYFAMSDLDDDNDTDIIAPIHNRGALIWYENNGEDTFYTYENDLNVTTIVATDIDVNKITYGITGTDVAKFDINSSTGVLTFKTTARPDYEAPADANKDNTYEISVTANDGNVTTTLPVKVTVEDKDGV